MLTDHRTVCEECPYQCSFCLKMMPIKKKLNHESKECIFIDRFNKTSSDNGNYLEGASGYTKEYEKRLKVCLYCFKKFPEIMLTGHQTVCDECPFQCSLCLKMMPIKKKLDHESKECMYIDIFNKTVSGPETPKSKVVPVVPVYKTSFDEDYLEKNFQTCPYCNNKIPEAKITNHIQYCTKGKKPCHFCGAEIRIDDEKSHLQDCIAKNDEDSGFQKAGPETPKSKVVPVNKSSFDKSPSKIGGPCSICHMTVPWVDLREHEAGCRLVAYSSGEEEEEKPKFSPNPTYQRREPSYVQEGEQAPCEFCDELFPFDQLIQHQSGCRPDIANFTCGQDSGDNSEGENAAVKEVPNDVKTPKIPQKVQQKADSLNANILQIAQQIADNLNALETDARKAAFAKALKVVTKQSGCRPDIAHFTYEQDSGDDSEAENAPIAPAVEEVPNEVKAPKILQEVQQKADSLNGLGTHSKKAVIGKALKVETKQVPKSPPSKECGKSIVVEDPSLQETETKLMSYSSSSNKNQQIEREQPSFMVPSLNADQCDLDEESKLLSDSDEGESLEEFWKRAEIKNSQRLRALPSC